MGGATTMSGRFARAEASGGSSSPELVLEPPVAGGELLLSELAGVLAAVVLVHGEEY
jgi:hypothetical protein